MLTQNLAQKSHERGTGHTAPLPTLWFHCFQCSMPRLLLKGSTPFPKQVDGSSAGTALCSGFSKKTPEDQQSCCLGRLKACQQEWSCSLGPSPGRQHLCQPSHSPSWCLTRHLWPPNPLSEGATWGALSSMPHVCHSSIKPCLGKSHQLACSSGKDQ